MDRFIDDERIRNAIIINYNNRLNGLSGNDIIVSDWYDMICGDKDIGTFHPVAFDIRIPIYKHLPIHMKDIYDIYWQLLYCNEDGAQEYNKEVVIEMNENAYNEICKWMKVILPDVEENRYQDILTDDDDIDIYMIDEYIEEKGYSNIVTSTDFEDQFIEKLRKRRDKLIEQLNSINTSLDMIRI